MSKRKQKKKLKQKLEIDLSNLDSIDPSQICFDSMKLPYSGLQPTFDRYLSPNFCVGSNSSNELDIKIKEFIDLRLKQILPDSDQTSLTKLLQKLMNILNRFKSSAEEFESFKIDNCYIVGSYRMQTMIKKNRIADVSIILKTLPLKATLPTFCERLLEELQLHEPTNAFNVKITDYGFDVIKIYSNDTVRVSIGTLTKNYPLINQEIHIKRSMIMRASSAINHAAWFEMNAKNEDIQNLIRIMKDVFERFHDFCHINPWMTIILCHYAITRTHDSQPLPINLAFKRILEVLSSGIFLPYSIGIPDPVEPKMPVHGKLPVLAQERITRQAQLLLRVLNYDCGCKYIFTSDSNVFGSSFDVAESVSYCDNIFLSDSQSLSVFEETSLKWLHYEDDHPDKQLSVKQQQIIESMKQELMEQTKNSDNFKSNDLNCTSSVNMDSTKLIDFESVDNHDDDIVDNDIMNIVGVAEEDEVSVDVVDEEDNVDIEDDNEDVIDDIEDLNDDIEDDNEDIEDDNDFYDEDDEDYY